MSNIMRVPTNNESKDKNVAKNTNIIRDKSACSSCCGAYWLLERKDWSVARGQRWRPKDLPSMVCWRHKRTPPTPPTPHPKEKQRKTPTPHPKQKQRKTTPLNMLKVC
eukprot:5947755-Amphidinium_carterae.1